MQHYEREMKDRAKQIAQNINNRVDEWLRGTYQRRFMLWLWISHDRQRFSVIVAGPDGGRQDYDVYALGLVCTRDLHDLVVEELQALLQRSGWEAKPTEGAVPNRPPSRLKRMYGRLRDWLEVRSEPPELPYHTVLACALIQAPQLVVGEGASNIHQLQMPPKFPR